MKTVVTDAVLVLIEDGQLDPKRGAPLAGQVVAIHKAGPQAIIGIDGHTSYWDEQVEVHWRGAHLHRLAGVDHVEIRDGAGNIVESLPVNGHREAFEEAGETVFFLSDME